MWQDQAKVFGHDEIAGGMPARLVHQHNAMRLWRAGLPEFKIAISWESFTRASGLIAASASRAEVKNARAGHCNACLMILRTPLMAAKNSAWTAGNSLWGSSQFTMKQNVTGVRTALLTTICPARPWC